MSDAASKQEQIQKLRKALTDAYESGKKTAIQDILKQLHAISVDEKLLRTTSIGQTVGKLRTHEDAAVAAQAKKLVHKWKKDVVAANGRLSSSASSSRPSSGSQTPQPSKSNVQQQQQQQDAKPPTTTPLSRNPASESALNEANGKATRDHEKSTINGQARTSTPPAPSRSSSTSTAADVRTAASDGAAIASTGDGQRDKCAEMLYNALAVDSNADSVLISKRASAIERIEFQKQGSLTAGYRARIRSLFLNLKDKKNPGLRNGVVEGEITAERFCSMTKEEMASNDLRQQMEKIKEENLFKAQGAGQTQAETDQFKCGRCKSRKCTYYQMQTRSADEPMTTFVTCTECDNRWKFC
ncbi:transcription elongation factor TFIIS [Dipsacomyces acuminosporus]|nr:transcription elongation factor TFIIS [Dipsacomyces acuminosporus]